MKTSANFRTVTIWAKGWVEEHPTVIEVLIAERGRKQTLYVDLPDSVINASQSDTPWIVAEMTAIRWLVESRYFGNHSIPKSARIGMSCQRLLNYLDFGDVEDQVLLGQYAVHLFFMVQEGQIFFDPEASALAGLPVKEVKEPELITAKAECYPTVDVPGYGAVEITRHAAQRIVERMKIQGTEIATLAIRHLRENLGTEGLVHLERNNHHELKRKIKHKNESMVLANLKKHLFFEIEMRSEGKLRLLTVKNRYEHNNGKGQIEVYESKY